MAIDPNIPLAAGQIGANSGNSLANLLQMRGQMIQQRAYDQDYEANVAQSEAIKNSIDPVTGQVDYNKAAAIMASDPRAARNLPTFMGQVAEQKSKALDQQQKELELAHKQSSYFGQTLAPFIGQRDLTQAKILPVIARARRLGLITEDQMMDAVSELPTDSAALHQHVKDMYLAFAPPEVQAGLIKPQTQVLNTGGAQQIVNIDPLTGRPSIAGSVQNTLSPEASAEMVEVIGPGGAKFLVPKGLIIGQGGMQQGGFIPGQQPTGNGRYPQGQVPGQVGVQSGLAPGQAVGLETAARGGAERYNNLVNEAGTVRNTVQGYDSALHALDNLGTSGPGLDQTMLISSTLESLGLPVDKDANANWQALNKYLANAAGTAAASAGYGGSDAGRAMFGEGQPSAKKMNPQALRDAIQYVKAQNLGVIAKQSAAQNFIDQNGGDYTKYSQFETKWNKAYNPDAMHMASLPTPEQKAQFFRSLPESKQKALRKSYNEMDALGAF